MSSTQPVVGGAATITIDNMPVLAAGVMTYGTVRNAPIDLGIIGMPGCRLHHNAIVQQTIVGSGTSATVNFPIPNNPVFIGQQFYTQAATLDIGLNALGLGLSDAAVILVGQ